MATKETQPLNPRAIFSKTGKGVQEASGKTSHLSRGDRAVLKEIDGKTSLSDISLKFEKISADKFDALIHQLDKDGFVREVSSGAAPESIAPIRKATPAAPPKATPKPSGDSGDGLDFSKAAPPPKGDDMDFTSFAPSAKPAAATPKGPTVDLAAAARAQAEAKAKEQAATDYRARQEAEAKAAAEAKAKAEADARARAAAEAKAKAEAEARARAEAAKAAEAKAKAEAEARAKAEAEAKARAADGEAKAKQARDMALRMASEAKAKAEAEAKDKARLEAELKGKLEEERKAREEAEKRAAEAAERARKDLEEKSKREAEEMRQRLEGEMKAKLEEERKAREEEDRKRKEEHERREREHEQREKEAAERRAKEEAERKQREEEDRKRREEQERRHKEEDERREKERAERRAKEEAESKRLEEENRKRREEQERRHKEEDERREKERAERRAKEEAERKREEEDRKRREEEDRKAREDAERRAREESERKAKEAAAAAATPAPAPSASAPGGGGGLGDSLLADLDSFGQRDEEERKEKEEAERKEKEAAARRAREEEERKQREAQEKKRREEEERRAKEEAERESARKAKEEEERRAREEDERRKAEEEERSRKAKEAAEKKKAAEQRAAAAEATLPPRSKAPARPAAKDDDIGVSDDDLDMDDVRRDEGRVSREARQAAKERDQVAVVSVKRPVKWGKPVAIAVFVILIGGIGALQVMPLSASDYEKAASEALGVPVKVSSARLSVITGVQVNLQDVTIGDVKIRLVRGYPEVGSVFGPKKSFNRVELEGAAVTQAQLGEAFFGKVGGPNFHVDRIVAKGLKADGPLTLPPLDIDATVGGDGALQAIKVSGDTLTMKLTPNGNELAFEASASSLAIPFAPALSLSDFTWKGSANRQGVASSEFDGRQFDGLISGTARVRWGSNWTVEGEVRSRGVKVGVFAPALVSEGKVEGRGNYTMSGPSPAKLGESAHLEGSFKIENGVIGNFALRRALETGGAQTGGRTEFTELTGQGTYDKGVVQLRNLNIGAGAMNAGANLDIDAGGNLAGRIAAEVKTPNQTLRAVLNVSGSLQNPVVKK